MFIAFEGIDGSGKTTISNRVAARLREQGVAVVHVREGGRYASPVSRGLREAGRDRRHLALSPRAELLLYAARDAQLRDEAIRPALAHGDVVIADRYLYSADVLARFGRGVSERAVRRILEEASGGLWPDLVVLIDCDSHVARARRRAVRIEASGAARARVGGRKGLAGRGLAIRLRAGYLALAAADRRRWLVVDNSDVEPDMLVMQVCAAIWARLGGAAAGRFATAPAVDSVTEQANEQVIDRAAAARLDRLEDAADAFYEAVAARATREPGVAAYLLSGLDDERAWRWREVLRQDAPGVVAYGLHGLGASDAWSLRWRLAQEVPHQVARSLVGAEVEGPRAQQLRRALVDVAPVGVLTSLSGSETSWAWKVREAWLAAHPLGVLRSLAAIDTPRAWRLREKFAGDPEARAALVRSVRGIAGPRAWLVRRTAFEDAPVATLSSLAGLDDDEAWQWRERWVQRAPKVVLRTFDGFDCERAWSLRERWAWRAPEAIDSIRGMPQERAWSLRERCVRAWPGAVIRSVIELAHSPPALALCLRAAARPLDVGMLRQLARFASARRGLVGTEAAL